MNSLRILLLSLFISFSGAQVAVVPSVNQVLVPPYRLRQDPFFFFLIKVLSFFENQCFTPRPIYVCSQEEVQRVEYLSALSKIALDIYRYGNNRVFSYLSEEEMAYFMRSQLARFNQLELPEIWRNNKARFLDLITSRMDSFGVSFPVDGLTVITLEEEESFKKIVTQARREFNAIMVRDGARIAMQQEQGIISLQPTASQICFVTLLFLIFCMEKGY